MYIIYFSRELAPKDDIVASYRRSHDLWNSCIMTDLIWYCFKAHQPPCFALDVRGSISLPCIQTMRLKIHLSSCKRGKWILTESNETYTECSKLQINVMCQTILEENVYWLSNEHRKISKSRSASPDTMSVVPSFRVQYLLLYHDWAKFITIWKTPEPCSAHQYLHATWSTFSDPFHTFSFTMQSYYQNSPLSLKYYFYEEWLQ